MMEEGAFWLVLLAAALALASFPLGFVMGGRRTVCVAGAVIALVIVSLFWRGA